MISSRGEIRRLTGWRLALVTFCLLGGATLIVASTAPASFLARGFGVGGVVKLRGVVEDPSKLAIGPGGAIFTLGRDGCKSNCAPRLTVSKLRLDGSLDRRYGIGGTATTTLEVDTDAVLAVDHRGRALVMTRKGSGGTPASIVRLDPGGDPDPSFGTDGVAITPSYGNLPELSLEPARGGLYVVASWQRSGFVRDVPRSGVTSVISIARFDADGFVDRGYGSDGEFRRDMPEVTESGAVPERRSGGMAVFATTCCGQERLPAAFRVTARGRLDRRFGQWQGFGGIPRVDSYGVTAAVARRNGKIDLYGSAVLQGKRGRGQIGFAVRLRRDGRPFGRFGRRHGIRFLSWPVTEAALDGRGRTVALSHDFGSDFGVFRLRPGGALDRSFASGGLATMPFPPRSENISLGLSRYRPVVLDEAPEACAFRGPPMCSPANPTVVAFRAGPRGKRARQ